MQRFKSDQLQLLYLLAASKVNEDLPIPRKKLNEIAGPETDRKLYERGFGRISGDYIYLTATGIREAGRIGAAHPDEFYCFMQENATG